MKVMPKKIKKNVGEKKEQVKLFHSVAFVKYTSACINTFEKAIKRGINETDKYVKLKRYLKYNNN